MRTPPPPSHPPPCHPQLGRWHGACPAPLPHPGWPAGRLLGPELREGGQAQSGQVLGSVPAACGSGAACLQLQDQLGAWGGPQCGWTAPSGPRSGRRLCSDQHFNVCVSPTRHLPPLPGGSHVSPTCHGATSVTGSPVNKSSPFSPPPSLWQPPFYYLSL